jgi:post-segregation antitoxin (ccd killing protein)
MQDEKTDRQVAEQSSEKRPEDWRESNRAAITKINEDVERFGLWSDGLRVF